MSRKLPPQHNIRDNIPSAQDTRHDMDQDIPNGTLRIIDGREAVTYLVRVKEAIEDPTRLLIDL